MEPTTDTTATTSFDKLGDKHGEAARPPVASVPDPLGSGQASGPRPRFTLRRSRTDRMLGGVCGGLAESLDVDPALLRIGLIVATVLGAGIGVVFYVAAWILAPEADAGL